MTEETKASNSSQKAAGTKLRKHQALSSSSNSTTSSSATKHKIRRRHHRHYGHIAITSRYDMHVRIYTCISIHDVFTSTYQYHSDPSTMPVCASQRYQHYSGNRHYSLHCHTDQLHQCQATSPNTHRHYSGQSELLHSQFTAILLKRKAGRLG